MSAEGINSPECRHEYKAGERARKQGLTREACPWGASRMLKRSLFLAGWHDMDIALTQGESQ